MFHSSFLSVTFLHFIFFLTFITLFIHIIAICYTECYDFKVSLGLLRIRSFWFWIFVAFIVFADFLPTLIYFMRLVNFLMNLSPVGVVFHETHVLGWDFMEPRPFSWQFLWLGFCMPLVVWIQIRCVCVWPSVAALLFLECCFYLSWPWKIVRFLLCIPGK